jgi:hypothetical protein
VPLVNKEEEKALVKCDDLTQSLYQLAKLQNAIQMATAIRHNTGPEAALRLGVTKLQE